MSRRVWILIIALLALLPINAQAGLDLGFAQEDGGQAGAFLDFAASARSLGMGGAHAGVADDASAAYWNPAGLGQVQRKDLVADYSVLWEDTNFSSLHFAQPTVDWGTFGLSAVSLRSSNYDKRDNLGAKQGAFNSSELALILSQGISVGNRLMLGSAVKVIRENIDTYSGTGYGLDGAAMFHVTPRIKAGLVLHNILAPSITLRNRKDTYARDVRLGTEFQAFKKTTFAVDVNQTEDRGTKIHLGMEHRLNQLLVLRAGLNETSITAGMGFQFNDWGLDYAFGYQDAVAGMTDLGASHRFGIHMNFGKKISEEKASVRWQKRGQDALVALRAGMNKPQNPIAEETEKAVTMAKLVIRHQGYLRAEDLYAAQGYVSYFDAEYERSVQSLYEAVALDASNQEMAQHLEMARARLTEDRMHEIVAFELKKIPELYAKADWKGTVKSCEKILSFQPDHVEAATYLADAKARINEPIERELKIGRIKFDRGDYLDAIKSFQKVLEMEPANKEASDYIAHSIASLEKQATIENPASQIGERQVYEIERNSEQSRVLYSKGLVLYSQGKVREAAEVWENAVRSDNSNNLARNAYNRAQRELNESH